MSVFSSLGNGGEIGVVLGDRAWRKRAATVSFALVLCSAGIITMTHAQPQRQTTGRTPMGDAVDAARTYSERNRAVGIVVFEGSGNAVTGQSIGQQFVSELQRRNVQARFFIAPKASPGMMVAYHLGDVAQGPFSVQTAAARIGDIARMRLAANRMLPQ